LFKRIKSGTSSLKNIHNTSKNADRISCVVRMLLKSCKLSGLLRHSSKIEKLMAQCLWTYYKSKLEMKSNSSEILPVNCCLSVFISSFFALKFKLKDSSLSLVSLSRSRITDELNLTGKLRSSSTSAQVRFYNITQANLSWSRTWAIFCQVIASLYVFISFFMRWKSDIRTSSLGFVILIWGRITNELILTGKISLKFDYRSSLLL